MNSDYEAFLNHKSQSADGAGFTPVSLPDYLFPFQRFMVDWAVRRGRAALFADCGLGKTPMQLVWADNVVKHTNGRVLVLTPLAVSRQTEKEAAKFGIDANRSQDGKVYPGITITNYERLETFDPTDFVGVVCDECFPGDTLVDCPTGQYRIDTLHSGDTVLNACGVDRIVKVKRKRVAYAIAFTASGKRVTASPNHPVFTQRGWVCAQDLEPGDAVLQTESAVRVLRDSIYPATVSGQWDGEVLREILLSEMEDATASVSGEGSQSSSGREARKVQGGMVSQWISEGTSGTATHNCIEPDDAARGTRESEPDTADHGPCTFRAWRKRDRNDDASGEIAGCARKWLGTRVEHIVGFQDSRLSLLLQSGLRERRNASRYRGGWQLPLLKEAFGCEKGCEAGFSRVESLEVLEQGHHELDWIRDASGELYFYDLEIERHPSFSVQGLLVHNSSILKSFSGATRKQITRFANKLPYRLLCTATAAPNDYAELGTSSEALGELSHSDMLRRFFCQLDDKGQRRESQRQQEAEAIIKADPSYYMKLSYRVAQSIGQWRLKHHAVTPFWRWVASWARACRKPSDLGFDDAGFALPGLVERDHVIEAAPPDDMLFSSPAFGMQEERAERRRTLDQRCEFVAQLVNHDRPAVIWCHMNSEGDRLEQMIPNARQISGSMSDERKIELYDAFASGQLQKLIIKPKIGAWGLNWQHCNHVVTFPSHSYEQYYQSLRRCWRFGQKREVTVDVVSTGGEIRVLANMRRKADKANLMFAALVREMNASTKIERQNIYTKEIEVPTWA